jgi:hypothetical protein
MSTSGEVATEAAAPDAASAYRTAAECIRRCLDLGDLALEYGSAARAAEYLLGALDDVAPELHALSRLRDR